MIVIRVCVNFRSNPNQPSCAARGSELIVRCLQQACTEQEHPLPTLIIERSVCLGYCALGPNLRLPNGEVWHEIRPEDTASILAAALAAGRNEP